MIVRRNFLQGLAAGAATVSMTSHSAMAVADASIRRAPGSMKQLEACVIACEGSEIFNENFALDYWTFNLSDTDETQLPEGYRKVVISGALISPSSAVQDIAELYQSIPICFDFDPLESPNHCALHLDGVTNLQEQIRSVLATKFKRGAKTDVALVSDVSICIPRSIDWSGILPELRTHYDRIILLSDVRNDEDDEFYDAEFEAYKKKRHEKIAAHCDISVRLPLPDYSADPFDDQHTTNLICETVDALLRKTPTEISALPPCGDIPFRDFMALVA